MLKCKLKAILLALIPLALSGYVAAAPVQTLQCGEKYWFTLSYDLWSDYGQFGVHEVDISEDCRAAEVYNIAYYQVNHDLSSWALPWAENTFNANLNQTESNHSEFTWSDGDEEIGIYSYSSGFRFRYSRGSDETWTSVPLKSEKPDYPQLEIVTRFCANEGEITITSRQGERITLSRSSDCKVVNVISAENETLAKIDNPFIRSKRWDNNWLSDEGSYALVLRGGDFNFSEIDNEGNYHLLGIYQ